MKKILLGLTTTSRSDWREKIKETELYNIKEIALFPTVLLPEERKKLYQLLEKSPVEKITLVHLRSDMEIWELDYLTERYKTEVFNIHPIKKHPLKHDYSKYANKIYIENLTELPRIPNLKKFAGLCLDFSHWEDKASTIVGYDKEIRSLIKKFKIGCCHISVTKSYLQKDPGRLGKFEYSSHWLDDLSELNYIKKYLVFLPEIISIELENSFVEQLKAKKYLEKMINNQD